MNENSVFSLALEYAELGYEVFPVIPGDKKPIIKGWPNAATTDKAQIELWIKKHPNANIGIKAGRDVLILDIDNKDGKNGTADMLEIIQELGELPKCPKVRTPTRGFHLYFKHPGIDVSGSTNVEYNGRKTGIDLRVGNQYIVAPPSIHPNGGTYEWERPLVPIEELPELPQSWVEGFLPLRNTPNETVPPTTGTPHDTLPLKIEGEIEQKAVKYLETCPKSIQGKGGRKTLFATAVALVRGLTLEPQRAAEIAWEFYNFYCYPFWTDGEKKEFDRMFSDAVKYKCAKQDGWLIDAIKIDDTSIMPQLAWEPFPIDCLPPVLRDFCLAVAKSTNTDPAYTAAMVLPVVSSATGAHIKLRAKDDWSVPSIIWVLLVADSGSGKTPTFIFALRPLIKMQQELTAQNEREEKEYKKKKQKYDVDLSIWKQTRRRGKNDLAQPDEPEEPKRKFCLISESTTEGLIPILADNPYGILSAYNEAAIWLGGFDAYRSGSGKDESIYNDIYDGGYVSINRKSGNQHIVTSHSHCSILGGIQPNSFKAILRKNPQFFHTGLFARLLPCMPPDTPRHFSEECVPKDVEAAYARMIETLFFWRDKLRATPDDPYLVNLTPEAKTVFVDFYNTISDDRSSLPSGAMKASLSKLNGYVLRIALTLHFAHLASTYSAGQIPTSIPDVDTETMRAAITLTEWFRRETLRVLQIVQPTEVIEGDKGAASILRHLAVHGETTSRTVVANLRPFRETGMAEAEKKLDEIVRKGLVVVEERTAANGVVVRYYSLPSPANAANANAVSTATGENGVGAGSVGSTAEVMDDYIDDLIPFEEEPPTE